MDINEGSNRKCSFCGEEAEIDSSRCAFCGSLCDAGKELLSAAQQPKRQQAYINANSSSLRQEEQQQKAPEVKPLLNEPVSRTIGTPSYPAATIHAQPHLRKALEEDKSKSLLGNGFKVFLTVFCTVVPGLGQLLGLIVGLVFMSSDDQSYGEDKRSFGLALVITSIIMFLLTCILWFVVLLALATPFNPR